MLFVGDLQLPPVSGSPVFERITTKSQTGVSNMLTFGEILLYMTNSPLTSAREKTKNFHQCWIVYDVAVQLMKLFVLFNSESYRSLYRTNSLSFKNPVSHLFVYFQHEKPATNLTLKCSDISLLKYVN